MPVKHLIGQVIEEAFEYRDIIGVVVEKGNVLRGAAALKLFAPELIPAGSVGKTNRGLSAVVKGEVHFPAGSGCNIRRNAPLKEVVDQGSGRKGAGV